jgi:hypothetical protein
LTLDSSRLALEALAAVDTRTDGWQVALRVLGIIAARRWEALIASSAAAEAG